AITSSVPPVAIWVMTGATETTCGSRASTLPTLIEVGAPVSPTIKDEPGGITTTSAPIPACRCFESFKTPSANPTINRINVTSSPMAKTLISDRMGRCTRFATIILFIISTLCPDLRSRFYTRNRLLGLRSLSTLCLRRRRALVQVYHVGPRRLLQRELLIRNRLVQLELHNL